MTRAAQTLAPADGSMPALESFAQASQLSALVRLGSLTRCTTQILKGVSQDVSADEQAMPPPFQPPPQSDHSPFPSASNEPAAAAMSFPHDAYDYWGAGAAFGSNFGPFLNAGLQDTAFFETLTSEDWSNGSASDGGLLGQMAATW